MTKICKKQQKYIKLVEALEKICGSLGVKQNKIFHCEQIVGSNSSWNFLKGSQVSFLYTHINSFIFCYYCGFSKNKYFILIDGHMKDNV